jgi:predicted MPP superfamily phosphohydrolase
MDVRAIKECPRDEATIVLAHNPSVTKEILQYSKNSSHPVDLILSGSIFSCDLFSTTPSHHKVTPTPANTW